MTAGGVEPRYACPVALFDNGYAGPEGGDQADRFVAGNKRKRRLDRPISVGCVEIGVADATRLRPDYDLPDSRSRYVPLANHEGLSEFLNHCCVHLCWRHGVPLFELRVRCLRECRARMMP